MSAFNLRRLFYMPSFSGFIEFHLGEYLYILRVDHHTNRGAEILDPIIALDAKQDKCSL